MCVPTASFSFSLALTALTSSPPLPSLCLTSPAVSVADTQESVLDVANFDQEFTSEAAQDSVVQDSRLSETVQDQFRGFTYNPADEHLSESVTYNSAMA